MPTPLSSHQSFIQDRLPQWLINADPVKRNALKYLYQQYDRSSRKVAQFMDAIEPADVFAERCLSEAFERTFNQAVDVREALIYRVWPRGWRMPLPHYASLLEAALQNYELDEAFASGSALLRSKLQDAQLPITPSAFAAFSRSVDVGQQYQDYLRTTFYPTGLDLPYEKTSFHVRDLFVTHDRDAFELALLIAELKGEISAHTASALQRYSDAQSTPGASTQPITALSLSLFDIPLDGVQAFQLKPGERCVLYVPGDPQCAVLECDDLTALRAALTERFWKRDYHGFFARFVPRQNRRAFFAALEKHLFPILPNANLDPNPVLEKGESRSFWETTFPNPRTLWTATLDKNVVLFVKSTEFGGYLYMERYARHVARIRNEAEFIAVPTRVRDQQHKERVASEWLEAGFTVLNVAALFVPGIGELMLVVAGAQLLEETYEGYEAWREGDTEQALEHFFNVAEAVATAVVISKVASVVQTPFVDEMIPVKNDQGVTKLWHPDLAPFERPEVTVRPQASSGTGIFEVDGAPHVDIGGVAYEVRFDSARRKWRMAGARGRRGFTPYLERDSHGQWSVEARFKPPVRTADGRLGYPLSGEGPNLATQEELDLQRRLDAFLPEATGFDYIGHARRLGFDGFNQFVSEHMARYPALRAGLEEWVGQAEPGTGGERQAIADRLSMAWRHSVMGEGAGQLRALELSAVRLYPLPALPEYYAAIEHLNLTNVVASAEQWDAFLANFPRTRELTLANTGLPAVPASLERMGHLQWLDLQGNHLAIDQLALDRVRTSSRLRYLDLSGNRFVGIDRAQHFGALTLYLDNCDFGQWPEWLRMRDGQQWSLRNNRMTTLPQELLDNVLSDSEHILIDVTENPLEHDALLDIHNNSNRPGHYTLYGIDADIPDDIAAMDLDDSHSSSDTFGSTLTSPESEPEPVGLWIRDGRPELNARVEQAFGAVIGADDAPELLSLISRLRSSSDYNSLHEQLTTQVLQVLEAAGQSGQLRAQLEAMASNLNTCVDGVRLMFSDILLQVYLRDTLAGVSPAERGAATLWLGRSLFRLQEVEAIADEAIAHRNAAGQSVDAAEVRLGYRIALADRLSLPAQPVGMNYPALGLLPAGSIDAAISRVLTAEQGPRFMDYMADQPFWADYLRERYPEEFSARLDHFHDELERITSEPGTSADYQRRVSEISSKRSAAERLLIKELTFKEELLAES